MHTPSPKVPKHVTSQGDIERGRGGAVSEHLSLFFPPGQFPWDSLPLFFLSFLSQFWSLEGLCWKVIKMSPFKESGPRGLLGTSSDSCHKVTRAEARGGHRGCFSAPWPAQDLGQRAAADGRGSNSLEFQLQVKMPTGTVQHGRQASGAGSRLRRLWYDEQTPLLGSVSPTVNRKTMPLRK